MTEISVLEGSLMGQLYCIEKRNFMAYIYHDYKSETYTCGRCDDTSCKHTQELLSFFEEYGKYEIRKIEDKKYELYINSQIFQISRKGMNYKCSSCCKKCIHAEIAKHKILYQS